MVADASKSPALWRLILGVFTVLVVQIAWMVTLAWAMGLFDQRTTGDRPAIYTNTASGAALMIAMIAGLGLGSLVAAKLWHGRGLRSLAGPGPRILRHFAVAVACTWAVMAVASGLTFGLAEPIVPNLPIGTWLVWLPAALLLLLAQTGSEELFFRGYLQSQLAARFSHAAIWLLVPALFFGLAHYLPGHPPTRAVFLVMATGLFGVIAGDLTARTGSLGAAWGFHFANNTVALLLISTEGSLTGLGLYRTADPLAAHLALPRLLVLDVVTLVVIWLVIRRALSR